jgi:hypothetical protein
MAGEIPAGWYPDADGRTRWWSGVGWTEHLADEMPAAGHAAEPEAAEPEAAEPAIAEPAWGVDSSSPSAGVTAEIQSVAEAATSAGYGEHETATAGPLTHTARQSGFTFDGGAATYFGTALLALLVTVFTLGICYPFALVLRERWRCKHTYIDGHRLRFNGTGIGLFGLWLLWFLLIIVTLGIYGFWVGPRIEKWKVEHTEFDPTWSGAQFSH